MRGLQGSEPRRQSARRSKKSGGNERSSRKERGSSRRHVKTFGPSCHSSTATKAVGATTPVASVEKNTASSEVVGPKGETLPPQQPSMLRKGHETVPEEAQRGQALQHEAPGGQAPTGEAQGLRTARYHAVIDTETARLCARHMYMCAHSALVAHVPR